MSAAWGDCKAYEPLPRLKRAWRMWTYVCIGSLFFLYLHFHLHF